MTTLYYFPHACSMAAHVALEEAGATYETKPINKHLQGRAVLARVQGDQSAFKSARASLRLDDGEVLLESTPILGWIGDTFPEHRLLGSTPVERAQTIAACAWLAGTVHPTFKEYYHPENIVDDAEMRPAVKTNYWTHLQELNRIMEGRSWLVGDGFTLSAPMCWYSSSGAVT